MFISTVSKGDYSKTEHPSSDEPHHHRGKLEPFQRGVPTTIEIGPDEEEILATGQPWVSTRQEGNIGFGKAVIDVDANEDIVWHQLLDFGHYPGKVPKVSECDIYSHRKEGKKERIKVRFVTPLLPGYKFQYFCDHTYEPQLDSLTWSLDYDRKSDFEDVQGHWHVEPHPGDGEMARVYYEVQLMVPQFLPKIIIDLLTKSAIRDATTWVKKYSEAEAAKKKR